MLLTYLESKHFIRGRPQVSRIAFQKRSQPVERVHSTESLEDTFSRSLADCERRKFDDLTVSNLGTDKNVSLPTLYLLVRVFKTCSMSLVLNI